LYETFTAAILPGQTLRGEEIFVCYSQGAWRHFSIFLALLQVLMGAYLIWHALQWLGYVRRRLKLGPWLYAPKAAVLCPCKGVEPGLERNLVSLTEFERQAEL